MLRKKQMNNFCIILARPQKEENIGSIARIMSNFSIKNLRIIDPQCEWNSRKAICVACNGYSILLHHTKIYKDILSSTEDLNLTYATSTRGRKINLPIKTPEGAIQEANKPGIKCGIIFGPEKDGLSNSEITNANAIITIPTSKNNSSLNLAQAACILCNRIFSTSNNPPKEKEEEKETPATTTEKYTLYNYIKQQMLKANCPEKYASSIFSSFESIGNRAQITSKDIKNLYQLINSIAGKHSNN